MSFFSKLLGFGPDKDKQYEQILLVALSLEIYISTFMAGGVTSMSPVNHSTFVVPNIFAVHRYDIAGFDRDARGPTDIMSHQNC